MVATLLSILLLNPPIGDMLFGGFSFYDPFFNSLNYTVAASPYSSLNDSDAKAFFMQPTLAPQQNLCLESSRNRHYFDLRSGTSHYLTHLHTTEGKNVLSCIRGHRSSLQLF